MDYYIFVDGSSSRKRGTIGSAFIIYDKDKKILYKDSIGFKDPQGRNGIAELIAIYLYLIHILPLNLKNKEIVIYSDSQYCVNELNIWFISHLQNDFYNKKNKEIIIYILYLLYEIRKYNKINIVWTKGHDTEDTFESKGNNLVDEEACFVHKDIFDLFKLEDFIEDLRKTISEYKIYEFIKEKYLYGTTI